MEKLLVKLCKVILQKAQFNGEHQKSTCVKTLKYTQKAKLLKRTKSFESNKAGGKT